MSKIDELAKVLIDSTEIKDKKKTSAYDTTAKVVAVEGNIAWISIAGGVEKTPASMVVAAKVGDDVRVRVGGGKAYVTGNISAPPTDDSYARRAEEQALRAYRAADSASKSATEAQRSANSAIDSANIAGESATRAVADAAIAKTSADQAIADAATAHDAADEAQASADAAQADADIAKENAQTAITNAEAAQEAADRAEATVSALETSVSGLNTRVTTAEGNITSIESDITSLDGRLDTAESDITSIEGNITTINGNVTNLSGRVSTAEGKVTTLEGEVSTLDTNVSALTGRVTTAEGNITAVEGDITTLQGRVANAEEDIDSTFRELAVAQDVVGTINWITNHGTMTNQAGQTFDSNQVYFIRDNNGDYHVGNYRYSVVSEPVAADIASYYLLSISESVQNYVATHIVVDSEGLWIVPDAGGNRVLIATGGNGHAYPTAGTHIIGKVNNIDTVLAEFTANGAKIGKDNEAHLEMDYHSMQMKDKEGDTFFHVSDLRDVNGAMNLVESFTGDGETRFVKTGYSIASITSITIDGVETIEYELFPAYGQITFTSAPALNSEIVVTYVTEDRRGKAYTFGFRKDNSAVGGMSLVEGYENIASGIYSHAEGNKTEAIAFGSHAEGQLTEASGILSHAEGSSTNATGSYSHAEGWLATASEFCSHAEGSNTIASGTISHAEGNGTNATGSASHAEGSHTRAVGPASHAGGFYTIAAKNCQHVIGKFNIEDTSSDDYGDYAFIIGNGTSSSARSNALTVDWDGNVWCDGDVEDGSGNILSNKIEASDVPTNETDPTVPSWAKASTKPSYTASEVGSVNVTTPMVELDTTSSSGTDYDLYTAINALGWTSDVIE